MLAAFICAALSAAAAGIGADQPDQDQAKRPVAEIIVTGERVRRSLRETPSSVIVLTDERLEAMAAPDRVDQVLAHIPNVQLGSGGQGPTIRGQDSTGVLQDLSAFLGGTRPRATLQVDGRAAGYNEFVFGVMPLYDVRQIEVFRSPQTTTQGRNSIAGAIIVNTFDPAYEWQSGVRALKGGLGRSQGSAFLTGPLIGEQLAFRLAADVQHSRPSSRIGENMRGADPNKDRFGLVRFKLLAEPQAIPGLRLVGTYVHSESQSPQIEGVRQPFEQRRDPLATYGVFRTNIDSLTANLRLQATRDIEFATTLSAGDAHSRRFAPRGLGETSINARDLSLESSVDWRPVGHLRLRGGLHFHRARLDQLIDVSRLYGIGEFDDLQNSLGLFGETEVVIAGRTRISAGLRYQEDRQQRQGRVTAQGAVHRLSYDESFSDWLPKVSLTHELSDDLSIGVLVQRAYNPGGVTLVPETGEQDRFDAERLWNYEAFLRGTFAGGALGFSVNIFYNDIRNAQRTLQTILTGPKGLELIVTRLGNAPAARSYGAELDLRWRASKRLTVHAAAGMLRTRIDDAPIPDDPIIGNGFARAPGFTGSAMLDWRALDRLRLSASLRYHSGYFSDDANSSSRAVPAGSIVDTRASYGLGRATLFAYARNLFDEFRLTYLYSPELATADHPRELGIGIETRF